MPLNFALTRKYMIIAALALFTLLTPLSSSILAPAIEYVQDDFNITDITLAAMPVSIYLLGYAIGPLFLSPLSEIYGRAIVLTCSNIFFCLAHIGCALPSNIGALVAFRFLAGRFCAWFLSDPSLLIHMLCNQESVAVPV
jgi:MFS family permease